MTTGCRLGEQFFQQTPQGIYWITDDFISLGFYQAFLRHGIDLIAEKRILSFGSPSGQVTQEMRMPVIGFCPMEIGRLSAEAFSAFLDTAPDYQQPHVPLLIPPAANPAALAVLNP